MGLLESGQLSCESLRCVSEDENDEDGEDGDGGR